MYGVMIKVDKSLPWIELKETYPTRREARKAAEDFARSLQVKIVPISDMRKTMKLVATIRP